MKIGGGSEIKYITALSAATSYVTTSAVTGPSNFAGYEWGTVVISLGSAPNAPGLLVNVQRSGTSDGTFAAFGASIAAASVGSRTTLVRSFLLNSSATWYRVLYDNNAGNWNGTILIALAGARRAPVGTQDTHTTRYSDVLGV